ncbi:hypothetical protein AURDEDRAFT_181547 [Auricularia subglabra TFB-10046 SS5]|nr:hypothetical protein AURDEDRAFT_181547 [Auricularia subglabra TFB-10046 SS5]
MESFAETFDLCAGIRGILDGYPASNAILRELIQNSDDAGSRRQIFILDERQHPTRSLLVPGLACCQGPALLAVNDSIFRPEDWEAIKTIHHSSKADDNTQIGKYGLGFRSSYHVTDFPQILSSKTLVVFDPHMTVLNDGGRRHSTFLPAESTHVDQLAAFASVVPADCEDYNGTAIRLPLRTNSSPKKISSFMPTVEWVKTLFSDFASKECAIEMLFLKSLESIELVHIDARGTRKQLAMSRIVDADDALRAKRKWTVRVGPATEHYLLTIQTSGLGSGLRSTSWRILHWFAPDSEVLKNLRDILGQAPKDLTNDLRKDKLFAHAACAFPTDRALADAGGPTGGHLFTLLPLPILTGFPLHVHGIFALTPTRQALKNSQETGLAGRDEMLVAWNKMMFQTVVPTAWARLLDVLAAERNVADIYTLWPDLNTSRDAYWRDISVSILKVVLDRKLPVWPVCAADKLTFVALSSALVAPPDTEAELLRLLQRLNITVVAPPSVLYNILPPNQFEALSAQTLSKRLKASHGSFPVRANEERSALAEYLVASPGDISCITELDLIPLSDGTFDALRSGSCRDADTIVLCDSAAVSLFDGCGRVLAAVEQMGPRLRRVLEQLVLRQRGKYNLTGLTPTIVREFLLALTSHIPPDTDESACMPDKIPWALNFWAWASQWSAWTELCPLIRDFHLLPTRKDTFRKLSGGVLVCEVTFLGSVAGKVLHNIGVPFLHDGAASYTVALKRAGCPRAPRDLRFILDNVDLSKCVDLSKQQSDALKRHLSAIMTASSTSLDAALRSKLAALPIYSTVRTRVTQSGDAQRVTRLGPAAGKVVFIGQDITVVPLLPQETFLENADIVFQSALQAGASLDEKSLLERLAPHLDTQPPALLDHLLHRILCRWTDLSTAARSDIQRRKALPVNADGTKRLPLCEAIDPAADIARLFNIEENVFPAGRFRPGGPWGGLLTGAGVLQSCLTEAMVRDRIRYFAAHAPDDRALDLLSLTDAYYLKYFATRWTFPLDIEFLPHPRQRGRVCSLRGCRDSRDAHLFDLVLPVIDLKEPVASNALRNALGWPSDVPFDIVLRQLACIVDFEAGARAKHSERLIRMIQSLAPRLRSMPAATLAAFRDLTGNAAWIPISRSTLCSTSHATHDVELGPFKRLPNSLLESQKFAFLEVMGCSRRPSLRALTTELQLVGSQAQDVDLILGFLKEIATYHELDATARAALLVPDVSGKMHAPDDVCFNNVPGTSVEVAGQVALCHPGLSSEIAERLDLRRLSDIFANRAEEEDEDEDEDFGEDLYDRIRGVLRDYSPNFALNEFIANANDAKATTFTVVLDETEQSFTAALSPELAECQAGPSLILHNDGVFTEADFHRIRRFGRTKETLDQHAIGQFGLGALNFYHFSDVVMIISGAFVLFIDPSKAYIPQKQRSSKRATLKYRLSVLNQTSPQHLARVNGLFGFSQTSESYNGTIFVLPLRSPARAGTSALSNATLGVVEVHGLLLGRYLDFARDSLFCTTLLEISCRRRQAGGDISELWKVAAKGANLDQSQGSLRRVSLRVDVQSQQSLELWYVSSTTVARERVPPNIRDLVRKDNFDLTLIATSAHPPERGRILSTVPMPVQTALPIHVSAPFIMASDRRTIRLEPPDAAGRRTAGSDFNSWLLESIVPSAYLNLLGMMGHAFSLQRLSLALWDWFPSSTHDAVSQIVTTAFYKTLPTSRREVIHTASKRLVSPQASVLCRNAYESRGYNSLLFRLQPEDLFNPSAERLLRSPLAFDGVAAVTAEYARRVLLAKQLSLQRILKNEVERERIDIFHPDVGSYNGVEILLAAIESALRYLLDAGVTLDGLKMLPLANGELGTLGAQSIVYNYSSSASPPVSFPKRRFIDPRVTSQTRERLVLAVPNVRTVNSAQSARDLLEAEADLRPLEDTTVTSSVHECITAFWNDIDYQRIRDVSADMLADLPLLRTDADRRYVSLNLCRQGRAVFPPSAAYLDDVVQELKRVGMLFCHESVRRILPSTEHAALEFTLANVLRGLTHLGGVVEVFGRMQRPECFARWVRNNLNTGGQMLPDVHRLPVWVAYGAGGHQSFMAADSLFMLPQQWSGREALAVLSQFIPRTTSFVAWDWTLDRLLQQSRRLDGQQVFRRLTFPPRCNEAQLPHFHALVELLRSTNFANTLGTAIVPDGGLSICAPGTLYDHRIPLFTAAFQSTSETAFAHQTLHDLIDFLVTIGVQSRVNFDTFLAAARAIHNDFGSPSPEFITRADVVVEAFMNDVPQTLRLSDSQRWYEIQLRRFVPATTGAVRGLTFNASGYLPNTDAVVSPAEIVRPEFETIAWTQCARLPERLTPPPGLISAFPEFGKPSVATVVAHLKVLATVVAAEHRGNQSLFTCLRDTYQWLNNCADKARTYLTSMHQLPLFLNIDSPNDAWAFKPASQLAVGLLYDDAKLFRVRDWLLPFKDLLLASGAVPIVQADFQRPAPPEGSAEARLAVLDTMRRSKVLTDCEFVSPTGKVHPAHKVVLASGSAHLRESFSGEWSDSSTRHIDETDFCIESTLCFLYVGRVERPVLQTNEEAGEILGELLELLRLADMWNLAGLKDEVTTIIAGDLKLVGPTTVHEIARAAADWHADALKRYCDEFIRKNRSTLDKLDI